MTSEYDRVEVPAANGRAGESKQGAALLQSTDGKPTADIG